MTPSHYPLLNYFMDVYERHLHSCHLEMPTVYVWDIEEMPDVIRRMRDAIVRGTYNKDSLAFKLTCKELMIKWTYKAIADYIRGRTINAQLPLVSPTGYNQVRNLPYKDE